MLYAGLEFHIHFNGGVLHLMLEMLLQWWLLVLLLLLRFDLFLNPFFSFCNIDSNMVICLFSLLIIMRLQRRSNYAYQCSSVDLACVLQNKLRQYLWTMKVSTLLEMHVVIIIIRWIYLLKLFDGKKIGYNCETALWKTDSLPNLYYYTYEESPYYFLSFLILISTLIFMGSPRVRLLQQQGMGVPLMCLLPYSAVVLAGWYNWYSDVLLSINRSFFVTCLILINFRE